VNLEYRSETCCTQLAENTECKKSPKIRHLGLITQLCPALSSQLGMYRQSEKNLLSSDISSTSPHNMVNVGPLTAETGSGVWGTPANFNRFRVLASLLHRRRSMEVNQTLHDVWPCTGLVHCIYIFMGSCLLREFCQVHSSLCAPCGSITACHSSSGRQPNFAALSRGRHLYLARQPSHWASAHILLIQFTTF